MKFKLAETGTPVKDDLGFTVSYYWHILKDDSLFDCAGKGRTLGAARRDALSKIKELEENAEDYIPQDKVLQELYKLYIKAGDKPLEAATKVLCTHIRTGETPD